MSTQDKDELEIRTKLAQQLDLMALHIGQSKLYTPSAEMNGEIVARINALIPAIRQHTEAAVLKAQSNFESGSAYAKLHADLAWCLGKLRGLGYPAEHIENRYHIQSHKQKEKE